MDCLYILDGHEPVRCDDLPTWSRWMASADRHVRLTEQGDVRVSTVFLGLDYGWGDGPPILFETRVLQGEPGDDMERYRTWGEAEAGHDRWAAKTFKPTPILKSPEKADEV